MAYSKAYSSTISAAWPLARQIELLADKGVMYQDRVSKPALKRRLAADLPDRERLFRPTSRQAPETVHVASLVCLAWDAADLSAVLAKASARQATIVALDTGLVLPPSPDMALIDQAIQAFSKGRRRAKAAPGQEAATARVARLRREDTVRRVALIAGDWPLRTVTTAELLLRAGQKGRPMAYSIAVEHLGARPMKQMQHEREQARLAAVARRKGNEA